MFKLFDEGPSCHAHIMPSLRFCSHRWVGNVVAKKALSIWPKMIKVLDFWKGLPKSKQPGRGRPGENKSYEFLLCKKFYPVKLRFFAETAKKLNNFLVTFQTSFPMMPFIVDSVENLVRSFVERFILPDVSKKANTTHKLSQPDMTDPNIQMRSYEVGFSIDHDLR